MVPRSCRTANTVATAPPTITNATTSQGTAGASVNSPRLNSSGVCLSNREVMASSTEAKDDSGRIADRVIRRLRVWYLSSETRQRSDWFR